MNAGAKQALKYLVANWQVLVGEDQGELGLNREKITMIAANWGAKKRLQYLVDNWAKLTEKSQLGLSKEQVVYLAKRPERWKSFLRGRVGNGGGMVLGA